MEVSFWTRFIVTKKNTLHNEMSFFDVELSSNSDVGSTAFKHGNRRHAVPGELRKRVSFSDENGPKHPNYQNTCKRLHTFEKLFWPPGLPQKPHDLAHAGFYYTGNIKSWSTMSCQGIYNTNTIDIHKHWVLLRFKWWSQMLLLRCNLSTLGSSGYSMDETCCYISKLRLLKKLGFEWHELLLHSTNSIRKRFLSK